MKYLAQIWYNIESWTNLAFATYDHNEALDYQQRLEYNLGYSCWIIYEKWVRK